MFFLICLIVGLFTPIPINIIFFALAAINLIYKALTFTADTATGIFNTFYYFIYGIIGIIRKKPIDVKKFILSIVAMILLIAMIFGILWFKEIIINA
ncbi:MAG: hypothetical protein IJI98_03470 [Methanosphaera sp.]|nr:hypothetical protein [Bacilli bacterium]MBR0471742.1 hypothetical protein [Methanosphaera sp.]